ncbi:uncharacterized protein F4822DRAFT_400428 [Hypoxylon trugodes]|uniref:uncharacterized protein n=1 Tax=Hypoxylon trugodes TaxID=326681 RepID=UPI0021A11C1F|nr:uncharacterized protein F4822DRAFT_400428 [Hypoxylon trugodes]KAI1389988.1 hypothetical protein F4822DRAFT_400428 [Hypoxylon trugodes]
MRASTSIAAIALLCRGALAQCAGSLSVLAGQDFADPCASKVSSDASALCSTFLGTSTAFVAAGTPSGSVATSTVTRVVFAPTTTTKTEVIAFTTTTTVTAAASPGPVGRRGLEINVLYPDSGSSSSSTAVTCPTLTSLPTDSASSSAVSSACSCLGASPEVTTVSVSSATVAAANARTVTTTVTVTSAIITYTKSTTTTSVVTATQTASYDRCSIGYTSGGNGQGNHAESVQATSSQDCCQQCQQKQNCVASVYTSTTCQHLIKSSQLSGAKTSDQCPLGIEDYPFGPVGGMVYPGPCGY